MKTFANGLRVIVQEEHRAPVVAVSVRYDVGSRDDPKGRAGFAHLFEHLMFEGSKHVAPEQHIALLNQSGATYVNAHTDWDSTVYEQIVPAPQLDLALFLESDRMGFLLDGLDQRAFASARGVVENEHYERIDRIPGSMRMRALRGLLFPAGHPYHSDTGGEIADLEAATLDDVRQFWLRWYAPNNATLVIVGDVSADDAFARAQKWFGDIPRGPEVVRWDPGDPPRLAADAHIVLESDGDRRLVVGWVAPRLGAPGEIEVVAASGYLGGAASRRFMKDADLASSVRLSGHIGELCSYVALDIKLRPNVTEKAALAQVDEAAADAGRFLRRWADQKDVRSALYPEYASLVFDLDNLLERAQAFASFDHHFGRPDAFVDRLRTYELVDESAVSDAYAEWVLRAHRAVVWMERGPNGTPAGRILP